MSLRALTRVRICAANMQIHVPRRKSSCNRLTSSEPSCRRKRKFLLGTQTTEASPLWYIGTRLWWKQQWKMKAKSYLTLNKNESKAVGKVKWPKDLGCIERGAVFQMNCWVVKVWNRLTLPTELPPITALNLMGPCGFPWLFKSAPMRAKPCLLLDHPRKNFHKN